MLPCRAAARVGIVHQFAKPVEGKKEKWRK